VVPHAVDLAIIYASVLAPCGFIIAYQWRTRGLWRRSVVGWHLMAVAAAELGPFLHLAAAVIWPWLALLAWFQWSYRASIAAMAVVSVWRTFMVFRRPARDQAPLPGGLRGDGDT
jgi:hypothetical protein